MIEICMGRSKDKLQTKQSAPPSRHARVREKKRRREKEKKKGCEVNLNWLIGISSFISDRRPSPRSSPSIVTASRFISLALTVHPPRLPANTTPEYPWSVTPSAPQIGRSKLNLSTLVFARKLQLGSKSFSIQNNLTQPHHHQRQYLRHLSSLDHPLAFSTIVIPYSLISNFLSRTDNEMPHDHHKKSENPNPEVSIQPCRSLSLFSLLDSRTLHFLILHFDL